MKTAVLLFSLLFCSIFVGAQKKSFSTDKCIEPTKAQLIKLGFIFKHNKIIYNCIDENLFYTFKIIDGKVKTCINIDSGDLNHNKKAKKNLTPMFICDGNMKFFLTNDIDNELLVPIIIYTDKSIKKYSLFVFFLYIDLVKHKISKDWDLKNYTLNSNQLETLNK